MSFKTLINREAQKGIGYWLTVIALILVGMWVGSWLEKQQFALALRYKIYQVMEKVSPRQPYVQRTVLVLIGDEEYWKGELARRSPIKRDYLGKLIKALDKADPTLIAVDFDLRSQTTDRPFEHPDYKAETENFLNSVKEVAARRPIILPKTVKLTADGYYVAEPDIYDGFDFQTDNVDYGYIQLPYDYRMLPLGLHMRDGAEVKSFAEAIASKDSEAVVRAAKSGKEFPYGTYLNADAFTKVYASEVLNPTPETLKKLRDKIVIIGGDWGKFAYRRGCKIDTHLTPVGDLGGVYMHANYVEALLGNRTYGHMGDKVLKAVEFIVSLILAVIFALGPRGWARLGLVLLLCVFLTFLSYLSWLNLGRFFDFFVPMILILGHAVFEQVREWRHDSLKFHERSSLANSAEA